MSGKAEGGSCKSLKILAVGDVKGRISDLVKRLKTVNKKAGPFDMAFAVGSFFNNQPPNGVDHGESLDLWKSLKAGKVQLPFPLYILGPTHQSQVELFPDLNGCELAENIVYLGRGGCLKTNEGLTVAYLSGSSLKASTDPSLKIDPIKQVKTLEARTGCESSEFKGVDVLITTDWPCGVTNGAAQPPEGFLNKDDDSARTLIARMAVKLRPRYHLAGVRDTFYERLPYRNHRVMQEPARHTTRFIGLAEVGNLEKKKWLYAFNIVPMAALPSTELTAQPPNATEMPFKAKDIEVSEGGMNKPQINTFFYSDKPPEDDEKKGKKRKHDAEGGGNKKPFTPSGSCWFCLSSAEVEKHLVVSIGNHSYLALAKGGLTPDHVMVLPIACYPSSLEIPEEVADEISRFKSALKKCFKKELNSQAVFFERNYRQKHLQLQVCPIPRDSPFGITLEDCCQEQELELTEVPEHSSLQQMAPVGTPYFYAEWKNNKYFHRVRKGFPMQFGREVLAHKDLLNAEDRVDWRECKVDKETETAMTQKFRQLFKPYDFTLEDDDDE